MTYARRKVSKEDMDQHRCEKCNCIISMFEGYRCASCKKQRINMNTVNIDKILEDEKLENITELTYNGKQSPARLVNLSLSRDVEDDPNYPEGNCGYVQKRPVAGYHYITLKFKVLQE